MITRKARRCDLAALVVFRSSVSFDILLSSFPREIQIADEESDSDAPVSKSPLNHLSQ
jgi:hypothetical protein